MQSIYPSWPTAVGRDTKAELCTEKESLSGGGVFAASSTEVDQQQGRVVLLGGFHSEDGQVASTGQRTIVVRVVRVMMGGSTNELLEIFHVHFRGGYL
eukprot:2597745-Amphidinium_carterae.1